MQQQYQELEKLSQSAANSCMVNISENQIMTMADNEYFTVKKTQYYDTFLNMIMQKIPTMKECMQFREVFSYVNLLEEFQKGKYAHSIKVLFELRNNTKRWTNININIMKHPETNNIVGFFHMEDIHDEEIANSVIHSLVKLE